MSIPDRFTPPLRHSRLEAVFPAFEGFGLSDVPARGVDAKRALDFAIALILIAVCLPVLALVTLLVAWDSRGPVLFAQRRIGRFGNAFAIYKFRTMHVLEDGAQVVQAVRNDARITRVGRWLRLSSLDELPQLFNVLSGEMSLVGPRPHAAAHDEYYAERVANYRLRHLVKPGITGWAQIHGARGATPELSDMQTRVDLDVAYVENESLLLDLAILARTPLAVLRHRNAV